MSPLIKALLGAALTLPLVAFVAGTLTTPEPVDEDRSRPVIIGKVSDDDSDEPDDADPRPQPRKDTRRGDADATDDPVPDDQDDAAPADPDDDGPTDDGGDSYRVVVPPPRNLDDGDDDGDDDDDNADADDSEGGSGSGSGGASGDD